LFCPGTGPDLYYNNLKTMELFLETVSELFERDLKKLIEEIGLYRKEENIWAVKEGISNPAGNLCLHLVGNLQHFIGAILGNTGYVRHREVEFSSTGIPRHDLVNSISTCAVIVKNTLEKLTVADLEKDFPLEKNGRIVSNMHMLIHLLAHLDYHLGQVNYHRRLLD